MKKIGMIMCAVFAVVMIAGCNSDEAAAKGAGNQQAAEGASQFVAGKPAPVINLTTPDGNTVSLADLHKDKPVYVNFWATWCPPCVKEMPSVDAMYTKYGDKINFAAVSVDNQFEDAKAFVADRQLTVPLYTGDKQELFNAYHITAIPVSILIGKDGAIISYHMGGMNEDELDVFLKQAL